MADDFKMQIEGLDQMVAKLATLGKKVHRKHMGKALRAGAKPVNKAMKANARSIKDTGAYAKSIGTKTKLSTSQGWAYAIVGARKGVYGAKDGVNRQPAKYAHLIERGFSTRDGGKVAARPVMRQAWDSAKAQAEKELKAKLWQGIQEEAK